MNTLELRRQIYVDEKQRLLEQREVEINEATEKYRQSLLAQEMPEEIKRLDEMIEKIDDLLALENAMINKDDIETEIAETVVAEETEDVIEDVIEEVSEPIVEEISEDITEEVVETVEEKSDCEETVEIDETEKTEPIEPVEEKEKIEEITDPFELLKQDIKETRETLQTVRPGMPQVFSPERR